MRVLALDIGEKRTGIAASDASGTIASPVCVLPSAEVQACAKSFRRVLDDYEPETLVVGVPISLDGSEHAQAARVRAAAAKIGANSGIPIEFVDERLSSREAKRILREQGMTERQMRGKVDMVAASLFLESYLESRGN